MPAKFSAKALAIILIALLTFPITARANELPLAGRTIILDPGHGIGDGGAYGAYVEHLAMLALSRYITPRLEELGARVLTTRSCNVHVPMAVRVCLVNKWALEAIRDEHIRNGRLSEIREINRSLRLLHKIINDPETYASVYINLPFDYTYQRQIHPAWQRIFEIQNTPLINENFMMISLHSNATGRPINRSINGADVFHISNYLENNANYFTNYANGERSRQFGEILLEGIDSLGIRNRGTTPFYFAMIRETNVPSVLVENGFHTNPYDRARLSDHRFLQMLAGAYANALVEYFSLIDEQSRAERGYAAQIPQTPLNGGMRVVFEGEELSFRVPPLANFGLMFFPLDDLLRQVMGGFAWDEELRAITASRNDVTLAVTTNNPAYFVNGAPYSVSPEFMPFIANDRLYVYIDIVLLSLGFAIEWDEASNTLTIRE